MKVFVIAGEASGDHLGAALMAGLKSLVPGVTFQGVGGPGMTAQGLDSLFPMSELSVMGLAEVLPRYLDLRRRLHQTAQAVIAARPDVLITIDSPDFCLRVVREVRRHAPVHAVHYVAPSVWAWRPKRAQKMAGLVDQVLALLPFEPPYMEAAGVPCDFVGHPVVSQPAASPDAVAALRLRYGLTGPTLCLLPGSRRSEIARLAPVFGAVLGRLRADHPDLSAVLPVAPGLAPLVREAVADWPLAPVLVDADEKWAAFGAATAALAASGTVSLELARAGCPMVIAYDMSRLSRMILSRMLRVDTVTLVNLVSDTRTVPEFIGAACRPEAIAPAIDALLSDAASRDGQAAACATTMERLGLHDEAPGLRAARAVLARMPGQGAPG